MPIAVLFPLFDHDAVEERYASWQAEMLHKRNAAEFHVYAEDVRAKEAVAEVDADLVLVVTDPLLLPSPHLAERLAALLKETGAFAALPVSNESQNEQQRIVMKPYMTVRELELEAEALHARPAEVIRTKWDHSDPGVYLCLRESLATVDRKFREAIHERDVAISRRDFVHRWASLRGQIRNDLLERIGSDATSILEFGCGEAPLGEALKKRQKCRVVGVEIDQKAAAVARKRIDDVYCADVREVVSILKETFDWIVGGDIVEHLDEPWSFLGDLRHLSKPGGRLLLSLPNISNASIVNDLLHGRFDYVYMGLTCVGHLRFFTKRAIVEMLEIAGWIAEKIEPQPIMKTAENERLIEALTSAGIEFSRDDLLTPGYYVTARNPAP